MKHILLVTLVCFLGLNVALGQQSGAQTLRLAQSIYEQGRLHELPDLLTKSGNNFTKTEQVQAYRLLTLAYIYLEEPEKADETMLKLLNTDHFFEPNKDVEPAEFIGLYKTFRTKPVFNIGLKFGANGTMPLLSSLYYVSSAAPGNGKYTTGVGIQFGLVFEKEIFNKWKNKIFGNGQLMFAPEVLYTNRTFTYSNSRYSSSDSIPSKSEVSFQATIKQTWVDINPIVQLKLTTSKTFIPYVGFGPGISYLLNAPNTLVFTRAGGQGVVSGPDVLFTSSFNKIVPSVIGLAGLKYRFGAIYLIAEFRVQYGLTNPVNSSTRTNPDGTFNYNFVLSNYKPLTMMANIGFVLPYFNPIKLKRK